MTTTPLSDLARKAATLPARLRVTAGTVNFNESRVLAKCMNDAADTVEALIERIGELEAGLREALRIADQLNVVPFMPVTTRELAALRQLLTQQDAHDR